MNDVDIEAITPWLEILWDQKGSDLLLSGDSAPRIRISGKLRPVEGAPILSGPQIDSLVRGLLTPSQKETLDVEQDVDFAFSYLDRARLRGSAFTQRGQTALALRMIPSRVPSFAELDLPPVADWLANLPRGFVLVTGPTGSGKSTTLASIIDRINETRACHILTIEDPVEYVHNHKLSAVSQREIGLDSPSFDRALRSALREDPDVLLIGEMRDIESIQIALTMAETGHLVFATLHTNDAPQAIDRIIDVFPAWRQEQTKVQLSASLAAIVAQRLVPKIGGGMVAAFEVLIANNPVRNLIREGRSNQLLNVMTTNQKEGMRTLEISLAELIVAGTVTYEDALDVSAHPKELARASRSRQFFWEDLSQMPNRPGPDLPYSIVAGVTPCATGWLVASAKLHGATFAPEAPRVLESFTEVLDDRPAFSVIALNAPVGYVDANQPGGRSCDRMARSLLGRRGSTVHNAPTRASLEPSSAETTDHLDAVTNVLLRRYREVAVEMAPYRQRTVYEVHPELSFFQINGDVPLRWSKKFQAGVEEREALLRKRVPGVERVLEFELDDVPISHLLDVAAMVWTARRIFARAGTRLPSDPEWDEQGLRMEFVR